MSTALRWSMAALLFVSACGGDEPKGKTTVAPPKTPHEAGVIVKPRVLEASVSTKKAAEDVISELMADESPGMKVVAVRAWSGLTGPASEEALRKALYEDDPLVHTIAAAALAQRGDFTGFPLLEESLQKDVNGASGIVITALRKLKAEKSVPALQMCLTTKTSALLASCGAALAYLGDKKGEELLLVMSKSPASAADVAKNLRFVQEPLALTLLSSLLAQDTNYDKAKVLGLISCSSFGSALDVHLQKALTSQDPILKGIAAAMLLSRGQDADPGLVAAALKEKQGPQVFSVLGTRLKKPDARLLPAIWLVLEGEPEGFPFAFQILQHMIDNKVSIKDTKALHALLDAVPNLTGNFPASIKTASAPTSKQAPTTTPTVRQPSSMKKLSDLEAKKLRAAQGAATLAAAYLAALGEERGVETMKKLLFWPNPSPAWFPAIEALRGEASYPIILLAAKHNSAEVRAAAIPALVEKAKAGDQEAYALFKSMGTDEAPNVRQAMLKDLSVLSEKDAEPIARRALTDRLYAVRLTAAISILSRDMQPTSQPDEE
jgi:HEAT repeat protein